MNEYVFIEKGVRSVQWCLGIWGNFREFLCLPIKLEEQMY